MARALAIVGMVMVHFGPTGVPDAPELTELVYGGTHGRAAILFGLLAGVGVSLLAGDRSPERRRRTYAQLAYRAAILLPLGFFLQDLEMDVAVILHFYAMYFLLAGAVIRLSDRALLGMLAASLVVGPPLLLGLEMAHQDWFAGPAVSGLVSPVVAVRELVLSGNYPLVTWAAPVLFGLWIGRRDLRSGRTRWVLGVAGAVVAVAAYATSSVLTGIVTPPEDGAAWELLVSTEPHSQMPLWLIEATATATAVLGLCLMVSDRLPRATWPLAAMGQLAFTIYVAHIVLLTLVPDLLVGDTVEEASWLVARFTVVVAAFAVLWRAVAPRGPLELLLHPPWRWR